jgi:hypothetical protein
MRWNVGLVIAFALCGCGRGDTKAPATDAGDATPGWDGTQVLGQSDSSTDVPALSQDAQPDLPAATNDVGFDLASGNRDAQVDLPVTATDVPPDLVAVGRDTRLDLLADSTDGQPDAQETVLDGGSIACSSLDECACFKTSGCAAIAEPCWCPAACGVQCFCGGGRYFGCVPSGLSTCAAASDRVGKLCPNLAADVTALCPSSGEECTTKCLNEVTSCDDLMCTTCKDCKCMQDSFGRCLEACMLAMRG